MRLALPLLLLLGGYLHYRLWLGDGSLPDARVLADKAARLRNGNEVLMLRNSMLHERIRELREGGQAVEEIARTELGLTGRDETFLLVVDYPAVPSHEELNPDDD